MLKAVAILAFVLGCTLPSISIDAADVFQPLKATEIQTASIADDRRDQLSTLADAIAESISTGQSAKVTFICTHNSRRSQFAQVWLAAAMTHAGLGDQVEVFSGGTEATACNPRTIAALQRAGFKVLTDDPDADNPTYQVSVPGRQQPITLNSKIYDQGSNPSADFIAVMCCGDADESCPLVSGSKARISLHYVDPKASDGTDQEATVYDQRCLEIAVEMAFVAEKVAKSELSR